MLVNHQDTELSFSAAEQLLLDEEEDLSESDLTRVASSNTARGAKRGRKRIHRESKI